MIAIVPPHDAKDSRAISGAERWLPAGGLVFVVLFFTALVLTGESGDNGREVLQHYTSQEGKQIASVFLLAASGIAYLVFVGALRAVLATAEREPRPLSGLGFAGGVVTACLLLVTAAVLGALTDAVGNAEHPEAFYILNSMTYPLVTFGIAASSLLALATGILTLRSGVLPRWVGWVSLVAAPIILIAILFIPIFGFLAWVAIVSVVLLMRSRSGSPTRQVAA
jgi:hypothetical protein